jgi:hypothetical protein
MKAGGFYIVNGKKVFVKWKMKSEKWKIK